PRHALRGPAAGGMAVAPSPAGRRSTMKNFRSQAGYTLVELITVVAIIGIVATLGLTSLRGYARREETRKYTSSVAAVLSQARGQPSAEGHMTFVFFPQPTTGALPFEVGQIAAIVDDTDGDGKITAADSVRPIFPPSGNALSEASLYGRHGQTGL